MKIERETGKLSLGAVIDSTSGEVTGPQTDVKASDLTTHGVIVGMTGSGKTGLGMVLLEEALMSNIPVLAIDPKGDLGNLCLNFPNFGASDFEPWIDPASAKADGKTTAEAAASTAELWKNGLATWGIDAASMNKVAASDPTIYTPGSNSGIPIDLLGGLQKPEGADETIISDEASATATGLLNLVEIDSDPLSGREHILITNLITNAWAADSAIDMPTLLTQIQNPPIRKLGVLDIDTFFPEEDRSDLVMKLNGLLASPTFSLWSTGQALDIEKLLWNSSGDAQAAVLSLSHLEEKERHFAITLVLSKLISWMKTKQGTGELRALVYIDEVMGMAPPNGKPSTKKPILTLLKQARAFGIGLVLSTQNPIDLDYKAISNAGTWMIGRLQTEQDKKRLADGLRAADGSTDIEALENTISSLGKRQFVLRSTKNSETPTFTTRWAMSYLAGPLASDQITKLMAAKKAQAPVPDPTQAVAEPVTATDPATTPMAPELPEGLAARFVTPSSPWLADIGADPAGTKLVPYVAARVQLLFDDTKAELRSQSEWEALIPLGSDDFDLSRHIKVDFDERDFTEAVPDKPGYVTPDFTITKTKVNALKTAIKSELYTNETLTLFENTELKLWSRPEESKEEFTKRCDAAAEEMADAESAKLIAKLETKRDRVEAAIAKAEDRVKELENQKSDNRSHSMMDVGSSILGGLFGGGSSTRKLATAARKISSSRKRGSATSARLDTAENRLEEKEAELDELEIEIEDAVVEIDDKWAEAATNITEAEIPLEKTDINVEQVVLAWVPMS